MKKNGFKIRLAGLALGVLVLLPGCIQKGTDPMNEYLYPDTVYTYKTDVEESTLTTGLSLTYLLLANKQNPLSQSYSPGTVVTLSTSIANRSGILLESRTADALYAMMAEMRADGIIDIAVTSGYRDYSYQQRLYEGYIEQEMATGLSREEAVKKVETYSAPPGYSEHQTGFVVDFITSTMTGLDESFEESAAFAWLSRNCYRFGFILRYPKAEDKVAITGYTYEPWHYRFVGREAATEIMKRGITLEEFLSMEFQKSK